MIIKETRPMPYTNKCPISFEPLTKENAFLIKVPKSNKEHEDIYYYIGDEKTLEKLSSCPFTRRQDCYYALKLSKKILGEPGDVVSKLLKSNDKNTLIDDNDVLAKIDKENTFNWELRKFENKVINHQSETSHQNLFTFIDNHNENQAGLNNRQIVNDYRASFFRHPSPPIQIFDVILHHNNLARYCTIVKELMNNALSDEHDLLFFIRSYKLISNLEEGDYKIALQNAMYAQLARYVAGLLVLTNAISIIVDILNNGFSSSTCFGILKIILIDRAQDSLDLLFRENKRLNPYSVLSAIFIDAPKQLANPSNIYASAKSAASNAYEFVKTNLSFFHNKFIQSEPVQYELPEDLANNQRRFNSLRF